MEKQYTKLNLLDLMANPAFLVCDGKVCQCNPAAAALPLDSGTDIFPLLLTGQNEYSSFEDGCLYVTITIHGTAWNASVVRTEDGNIFVLDAQEESPELRALALAARELRSPLSDALIAAEHLESSEATAKINRTLYRLLRIVSNMSDAGIAGGDKELQNLPALFAQYFEHAAALAEGNGVTLTYHGLNEDILGLVNSQLLERAVLNILSNSLKFTPKNGKISAKLVRKEDFLLLQVCDSGSGIPNEILGTLFCRHQRSPAIEDSRLGLGLGMQLIRQAAACHGGTVLVDRPEGWSTRITMTIRIEEPTDNVLHTHRMRFDYAGERDHALVELSDVLPPSVYLDI